MSGKSVLKTIFVVFAVIFVLSAGFVGIVYHQMKNYPVIKVNGIPVSRQEYKDRLNFMKDQYSIMFNIDFTTTDGQKLLSRVKEETINDLAQWKIVEAEAKKRGISISNKEVDSTLKDIEKEFPSTLQFELALAQYGLDRNTFREEIKKNLLANKLIDVIGKDERVTETETKKYYEENIQLFEHPKQFKVYSIVLKDEKKANEVYNELISNKITFTDAAKKYSEDITTKDSGGELGYVSIGELPEEVEKITFTLPLNQISKPIKTEDGYYYITKVTEIKEAYTTPYLQAKTEIEDRLLYNKKSKVFSQWLEEELNKAKIEKDFSDKDIWMRIWRKLVQIQQVFYRKEARTPLPKTDE
ncbi:MAG TPA: SurA N-terminal domain-containing protein [Dictyoglomaceae bacterium]|nr:SurA N-terminal domain-containing protein [Dictyoglomaceae bacterium]HOL39153.1 SurA N-terminal domain-containing protein [Dictyoglomaceae bacterium]HOP94238.1 SurA N-terminal domain-containing protein [Dictyoglomaceae bacterium]HPP15307.1 SurA N-terminal domain-containing protein [Dictyoglomaceae bacterium]HPU42713.1 SurA N-terminal domain-containing protein [Dictyoglomaceae bacterium]